MKTIKRTPHQAMSDAVAASDQTDCLGQHTYVNGSSTHQVADLHILNVWNDRRQRLIRPVFHLL